MSHFWSGVIGAFCGTTLSYSVGVFALWRQYRRFANNPIKPTITPRSPDNE